jgi:hypothetical protein
VALALSLTTAVGLAFGIFSAQLASTTDATEVLRPSLI